MQLDQETFNAGIIALKSTFRIDSFDRDTVKTWRTMLQAENISNSEYMQAIKSIARERESFNKNNNLVAIVLAYIPAIRQSARSDRAHLLALKEAKEAKQIGNISEAEAAHNIRKLSYLIELQEALKREPRREGETAADWFMRKHSIVERKLIEFDDNFYGGKNGEKRELLRQN